MDAQTGLQDPRKFLELHSIGSEEAKEISRFRCNYKMEYLPVKKIEFDDEAHLKKYIMWENKSNICWLDSSMALIAHNKVMKKYSGVRPQCSINKIISAYDDAINIINGCEKTMDQKLNLARGRLNYIQESTLEYLQPILKYKIGDPESAFCSLYNLLKQDPFIQNIFDVTWLSVKECTDCGHHSESIKSKPIVTLCQVDSFDPENLTVIYHCDCNKSEQKIKLVYVSLPPCLIFHFENGAGNEKPPLSFITQGRKYHLTGIMTLDKSQDSTLNHFITWVRDLSANKWLDCNDLNLNIIYFSPGFPDIDIKDVYIYVYEAFDDLGTITGTKIVKAKISEENIPCFELSEESDIDEIIDSQISAIESNKDTGKMKTLEPDLKSSSAKLDSNALGQSLSTDKSTIEKNIQQIDLTEHLKYVSNNMANVNINESQIKPKETDEDKIHRKNNKTDNKVLKTLGITSGSNLTSNDNRSAKEINESICTSDVSAHDDKITEKIYENSCLFPSSKHGSLTLEGRHDDFVVKHKISAETEPSFDNENKKVLMNTTKIIQEKELLSKEVCSNASDISDPKSLKNLEIRDLIQSCSDKTNVKKDDMNNSEQLFTISNTKQRDDDRLILNSNGKQDKLGGLFVSHAYASSSRTSYVKLSFQQKKSSSDPLYRANSEKDAENPDLSGALHNTDVTTPSTSTSLKRNRVAEDCHCIPLNEKSKKKKLSNVEKDSVRPEKKAQEKDLKNTKKVQAKSKLNCTTSMRTIHGNSDLDAVRQESLNDNLNLVSDQRNSDNDVNIPKIFEQLINEKDWSCHELDCNCDSADLKEIVDTGVDFVFSYFCKLSKEFQKFNE